MAKRRSSESAGRAASVRSHLTTARSSSTSCFFVGCVWIFRAASNLCQLIFRPYQHYLLIAKDGSQKVVLLGYLFDEFGKGESGWVDLAADSRFQGAEPRSQFHCAEIAKKQKVHVAAGTLFTAASEP